MMGYDEMPNFLFKVYDVWNFVIENLDYKFKYRTYVFFVLEV